MIAGLFALYHHFLLSLTYINLYHIIILGEQSVLQNSEVWRQNLQQQHKVCEIHTNVSKGTFIFSIWVSVGYFPKLKEVRGCFCYHPFSDFGIGYNTGLHLTDGRTDGQTHIPRKHGVVR